MSGHRRHLGPADLPATPDLSPAPGPSPAPDLSPTPDPSPAPGLPPPQGAAVGSGLEEGGGPPSWEYIAARYGDTVYTMAYRLTGDRDEASDLAQDVFVRVYRNLDRYRPGTFEGWLYRITKNLFLDRVRRRARIRIEPLSEDEWRQPSDQAPGPAEHLEAGVLGDDLEDALYALPPAFRTAVVLCDVQGLTYQEIAQVTGWPVGTVRSRIHRGRRLLKAGLDERRHRA